MRLMLTCQVAGGAREGGDGFLLRGVPHLQIRHQHGLGLPSGDGQAAHLPPVAKQTPASRKEKVTFGTYVTRSMVIYQAAQMTPALT